MRRFDRFVLIVMTVAAVGTVAAKGSALLGWGHGRPGTASRDFAGLRDFDGVVLNGSENVVVTRAKAFSVRAQGDKDAIDQLDLRVQQGTLQVSRHRKPWNWFFWGDNGEVTVRVTVPTLARASLNGSGDLTVDRLTGDAVKAGLNGPGDLRIGAIDAGQADLLLSGSGDLTAAGHARSATLTLDGSGDLRAQALQADMAAVHLTGSGDAYVRASGSVTGSMVGSGDIHVAGAKTCRISKTGSGDVHCPV